MILHLMPNEKFILNFIQSVEDFGDVKKNRFIVRDKNKKIEDPRIEYVGLNDKKLSGIVCSLEKKDQLIIHFLDYQVSKWLSKQNLNATIKWIFYGAEFYKLLNYKDSTFTLFDPLTKQVVDNHEDKNIWWNNFLTPSVKRIYDHQKFDRQLKYIKKFIHKIDSIYHFNPFEVDLINNFFCSKIKFQEFAYTNFHTFVNTKEHADFEETQRPETSSKEEINLLIGNSSSYSNNHLDVFEKVPPSNKINVYSILSYGKKEYCNYLIKKGKNKFGNHFYPITDFYTYEKYFELLDKMDACVMGQNRAQAAGGIFIQLFQGKKIFLKKNNPLYQLLHSIGIEIYRIDLLNLDNLTKNLDLKTKIKNRKILIDKFGGRKLENIYKELF